MLRILTLTCLLSYLCLTSPAAGNSTIADDFDSTAPLAEWSLARTPNTAKGSIMVKDGVLTIQSKDPRASLRCQRELPWPVGQEAWIRVAVRLNAADVSRKPASYNGIKVMLRVETARGIEHPQLNLPIGDIPWSNVAKSFRLPDDTRRVTLVLGLERVTGRVSFDRVEVFAGRPRRQVTGRAKPIETGLPRLRGVMHGPNFDAGNFADLDRWGVNQVRWQLNWVPMRPAWNKAMDLEAYDAWLQGILDDTDRAVEACEKYGIHMLLDLHCAPGGRAANGVNRMFLERRYQDKFIEVWQMLAQRYRGRDIIYAYDLINEPSEPTLPPEGLLSWCELAILTTKRIREIDPDKPIVYEPGPWGRCDGFDDLEPLNLPSVIYSFHMYQPHDFTHQFQLKDRFPDGLRYPGEIDGQMWDRDRLRRSMRPAIDFANDFGVPMYVGEFSAIRWAPDESAYRYLKDLIEIFEEEGWDWSYHAFREFHGWSVEHSTVQSEIQPSQSPTRREVLLKDRFRLNRSE